MASLQKSLIYSKITACVHVSCLSLRPLVPPSLRALSIADYWDETKEGIVPRPHYVLVLAAP